MLNIVWILVWGLAGYFTVGAIKMHIERKRMEKEMVVYLNQRTALIEQMKSFKMAEADSEKME